MANYPTFTKPRVQLDEHNSKPKGSISDDNLSVFERDVSKAFKELEKLLISKHKDYGPRNISEAPGGAINGLRVRMHDKLARINNLVDNNKNPEHESLEDSFKDMANYAIIGLLVLRDKWDK